MRRIISTFTIAQEEVIEFFVEALFNKKWKQVGGPFDTRSTAEKFAKDFAIENKVRTRVVAEG